MPTTRTPAKEVLLWLACIMAPAGGLLTMAYGFQPVDLTGPLALASYWIAESGGIFGIPLIASAMITLVVGRSRLTWKQRGTETLAIIVVMGAVLGGTVYLNEHFVKPVFAVPRPNLVELAETQVLKMSAEEFYAMPTKALRSDYLTSILPPEGPLHERIRAHWISETGYSFPSGHSFSAMLFATFFLGMGLTYFSGRRLWVFYFLVVWAVAVCFSRPILRVHSPTDICVGGLEGIVAGVLAFLLVRWVLVKFSPEETR